MIAQALIERETLDEEEINQLVKYGHILSAEEKLYLVQKSVAEEEAANRAAPVDTISASADTPAEPPQA